MKLIQYGDGKLKVIKTTPQSVISVNQRKHVLLWKKKENDQSSISKQTQKIVNLKFTNRND